MFRSVKPEELSVNPFQAIGKEWMLITAEKDGFVNPMTASWGGLGIMWNEPVATCYIRPQRYTRELVDDAEYFALCFFGEGHREELALCGRVSGRDADKVAQTGLTVLSDKAAPYFAEASMVLICRKLYRQEMKPECCIDPSIASHYPTNDYHVMYLGKVEEALVRE